MNTILRLTSVLALVVLTTGANQIFGQAESDQQPTTVAIHMHEQLERIGVIKSAIIAGKLEDVRESAIWLADHDTITGLPADFEPFIAQMKTYARHVIEAPDLMAAATAVSQMARICGDCHLAYGVQLEFGYDSLPSEELEDVVTHMQRHLWAVDRLWEGLIGPSDSSWNRGADMLVDEPLTPDDVTITIEQHAEISNITRRIHAPGGVSAATVTPDARSGLFGEVLGLCAACHVMLGRGPANQ